MALPTPEPEDFSNLVAGDTVVLAITYQPVQYLIDTVSRKTGAGTIVLKSSRRFNKVGRLVMSNNLPDSLSPYRMLHHTPKLQAFIDRQYRLYWLSHYGWEGLGDEALERVCRLLLDLEEVKGPGPKA